MPKAKTEKSSAKLRHNPLAEQILEHEENKNLRPVPRQKRRGSKLDDEEDESVGAIPSRVTKKLLEVAQQQKVEEAALMGGDADFPEDVGTGDAAVDQEEMSDVEVDEEGFVVTQAATEEEERAMAMFMPGKETRQAGPTLADIILNKIKDQESKGASGDLVAAGAADGMSAKAVEVYTDIGKWLKHYKAGKIPKAFKVIPNLVNWEEVLAITHPLEWSPAAMYEATVIFSSNLNPKMAQRFYNLVLLPAVRENIGRHKKLNFHYYRALHKAFFKPAAFFKGILLPLAQENCSLREACIVSSVLTKTSIPMMHSAACLTRLSEMTPWYGTTSIFIATLLNKKYTLPIRVVEALVAHFSAFAKEETALPVVWHRNLLIFIQRYKWELDEDQRKRLKDVLRVHCHEGVGPEARRELFAPKPGEAPSADVDMS